MDGLRLFQQSAVTLCKRGREVVLIADTDEEAEELFDWLEGLGDDTEERMTRP